MKHWFFTFSILVVSISSGSGQDTDKIISKYFTYQEYSKAYTFGDKVKLRSAPDTSSDLFTLIPINSELRIIATSSATMDYDGIRTPWYKVEYQNQSGFILGGLIALQRIEMNDHNFLIQLSEDTNQQIKLKIRLTGITRSYYTEHVFDLMGEEFKIIREASNRGLKGIDNFIVIDYFSEACAVEGGLTYLTWNGKDIQHFADCTQWSDAGIGYINEEIIYPLDSLGIEDKIIFQSTIMSNEDEATQWTKTTTERREHTWDGEKLVPPLKNSK